VPETVLVAACDRRSEPVDDPPLPGHAPGRDSGIIDHAGLAEDGWLVDLVAMDTDEARREAQAGSVEDWATEPLVAARQAYQDPVTGQRIRPGAKLGERYQEANLPVAKRRHYQAGVR
jgi:hypothetical protein